MRCLPAGILALLVASSSLQAEEPPDWDALLRAYDGFELPHPPADAVFVHSWSASNGPDDPRSAFGFFIKPARKSDEAQFLQGWRSTGEAVGGDLPRVESEPLDVTKTRPEEFDLDPGLALTMAIQLHRR